MLLNGLQSKKERSREPERLLEWGFREFDNYQLLSSGEIIKEARVWLGTELVVPIVIEKNLKLTLHKKARREMVITVNYNSPIPAPVKKGDRVATLKIRTPDEQTVEVPLFAAADVKLLGLVGRVIAAFKHLLWGSSG